MNLPRPNGRPKDDTVVCPECGSELTFNWDVVSPSEVKLEVRSDYAEALHPLDESCAVARVAISRSDPTEMIPVEWYRRDGTTVNRTWDAPGR